jgi:hypothetical protein
MPERHQLNIDGRLVAAGELAGDHSWTTVRRDEVLVFRDKGEYQLA